MNKMQEIRIEKVTLNIGTGGPGENLEKARKLIKNLTNAKTVPTTTKKRIPAWSIRPGLQIGTKTTLRGRKAEEFFKRAIDAKSRILNKKIFDKNGNLSFGISEYLDIPGAEYDMSVGIIGLEVAVTLSRPGFRIAKRRIKTKKIPKTHRISRQQAIDFITSKYLVALEEEE